MAPERAGELMRAGKLHAYVGGPAAFAAAPDDKIGTVESLGAFIVVRLNPDSRHARDEASACAAAGAIVRDMAARASSTGFVSHPYPVTPFHGDYLAHADRAEAARQRLLGGDAPALPGGLEVRAGGLARDLVRPEWLSRGHLGCRHRGGRRRGRGGGRHGRAQRLAGPALDEIGLVSRLSAARGLDHGRRAQARDASHRGAPASGWPTRATWSASIWSGSLWGCSRRGAVGWSPATR